LSPCLLVGDVTKGGSLKVIKFLRKQTDRNGHARVQSSTSAVVTSELEGHIAPLNLPSLSLEGPIFSWLCPRKPMESSSQSLLNGEAYKLEQQLATGP